MWWRIFVPTWRFFDEDFFPELFVREGNAWRIVWPRPKSKWYSLVFNPRMSEYLARRNLLDRLVLEVTDGTSPSQSISFSLVRNMLGDVEFKIVLGGEEVVHFTPSAP